mgnify:CR=1 FL=1
MISGMGKKPIGTRFAPIVIDDSESSQGETQKVLRGSSSSQQRLFERFIPAPKRRPQRGPLVIVDDVLPNRPRPDDGITDRSSTSKTSHFVLPPPPDSPRLASGSQATDLVTTSCHPFRSWLQSCSRDEVSDCFSKPPECCATCAASVARVASVDGLPWPAPRLIAFEKSLMIEGGDACMCVV